MTVGWLVLAGGAVGLIGGAALAGWLSGGARSTAVDLLGAWALFLLSGTALVGLGIVAEVGPDGLRAVDPDDPRVLRPAVVATQAAALAACAWLAARGAPMGTVAAIPDPAASGAGVRDGLSPPPSPAVGAPGSAGSTTSRGPGRRASAVPNPGGQVEAPPSMDPSTWPRPAQLLLGAVAGLGQLVLTALIGLAQSALGLPVAAQGFVEAVLQGGPGERAALLGLLVVVPPFVEELLVRGHLHGVLERARGPVAATFAGGLVFGLLHASDPAAVPSLLVFGWLLGALRACTGSVWAGVVAHLVVNALGVASLLA